MTTKQIIDAYIRFFESKNHKRIAGAPLVPQNDPTTLFTSSGMQPLIPYLLGETHPSGTRLVDVQNCFRAVDIEEVGDDRHTTFYRMLGNWSLGDYFKSEQLTWLFTFLTQELRLDPKNLYVSVFRGYKDIPKDTEANELWEKLFRSVGIDPKDRIFVYDVEKNWWSRSGTPETMPVGEPGGPDSEVFYDFGPSFKLHENSQWKDQPCHINCDCGRYWEICNSVFMQYIKQPDESFAPLPKKNIDFGGGLERILGAATHNPDMFQTSLFLPTITHIEKLTQKKYASHKKAMQIIADHFGGSLFMLCSGVTPSNKEQGYILRRLIRRGLDNFWQLGGEETTPILETIVEQYKDTDPEILEKWEGIKYTFLLEEEAYKNTLHKAKQFIAKKYKQVGDELMGQREISAEDAFLLYATHGLSPTQIENLGFIFDRQAFAVKMEEHQHMSRLAGVQKFAGGLQDHQTKTIMGHTATHLLQQALRDVLGNHVFQTGSNITSDRLRFDFSHPDKLTDEQLEKVEAIVKEKIKENLPVHFEMLPLAVAKKIGAIGLFDEKYQENVKVYFIGGSGKDGDHSGYSKEFCGGPHVNFTGEIKSFKILKQENIGNKQRRIYAQVG